MVHHRAIGQLDLFDVLLFLPGQFLPLLFQLLLRVNEQQRFRFILQYYGCHCGSLI